MPGQGITTLPIALADASPRERAWHLAACVKITLAGRGAMRERWVCGAGCPSSAGARVVTDAADLAAVRERLA